MYSNFPTISICLKKDRRKNNGKYPLKLRVTFKGDRKFYATGYDATESEWKRLNNQRLTTEERKLKSILAEIVGEAINCARKIENFSPEEFERSFFDKRIIYETLEDSFNNYIRHLERYNQWGTASSYRTALSSFLKFKSGLKLKEITPDFLKGYQNWMINQGRSITTVGIYLRSLRAVLNAAKENGAIKHEDYPFGKKKFSIPTGRNIKKALDRNEVKKIFFYETEEFSPLDRAKDFWIFSYLCNGINMKDIALLKWKNLTDDSITFERSKTKNTKRSNGLSIMSERNEHINRVIEKWGNKPGEDDEDYIFKILQKGDSEFEIRKKVKQFTKVINEQLFKIGEELELNLKLTTYVARHSFATIMMRGGASIEAVSQALGHSSIITTKKYFAGFGLETMTSLKKTLTDFQ